jgi:hypothetical protein
MWPNCRSSGVATDDAMISALAPGRLALTEMVGKSTCGSGDTGSTLNAIAPGKRDRHRQQRGGDRPWMKGAEMFMRASGGSAAPGSGGRAAICARSAAPDCRRRCR